MKTTDDVSSEIKLMDSERDKVFEEDNKRRKLTSIKDRRLWRALNRRNAKEKMLKKRTVA